MNKMYFNRTMMKNAPQQHQEEYYSVGARMKETTPGGVKQHTNILIHRCSPSTATTDDIGGAGAVGASEAAIHSSKSSLSRTGWSCEDVLSTSSQSPSEPSLAQTHAKPLNNPPLQWTTEELRLVSRMREGMMKSCRRKRSKKPKDAPRRPLRYVSPQLVVLWLSFISHSTSVPLTTLLLVLTYLHTAPTTSSSEKSERGF